VAFGGRELRLILSIQSYGTSNIQRLRRDIASLGTATDIANKKQMLQARMGGTQVRMKALDRELSVIQQGTGHFEKRRQIVNQLSRNYSSLYSQQSKIHALDATGYELTAKRLGLEMRKDTLLKQAEAADETGVEFDERKLQQVNASLKAVASRTQGLVGAEKALSTQMSISTAEITRLDAAYKELSASTHIDTVAEEKNRAAHAQATATLKSQTAAMAQLNAAQKMQRAQRVETQARTIAHIGRTAQFAGLIATAGFSLAANAAASFSEKLYLAGTQTRGVTEGIGSVVQNIKQLEHGVDAGGKHIDGILDLMQQFPATGDEMADASYDIYSSMQVSFGGGLKLLKSFNQLAVATGSDLKTATSAGITVLNNFSRAGKSTDEVLNLMVSTIRFGRMHLAEFNQMLNKVAPAAAAAGQSFEDVAGAMALLTTRQPSQQISATGIARLLQTFRDPDFQKGIFKISDGLVDITRGKGAAGALKPLPTIIDQMAKSFGLFVKEGGPNQLFKELTAVGRGSGIGRQSRIEAANAYVLLVKNLKDYRVLQQLVTGDTTEFARALKIMSASPGVRWKVFINQMRAFLIVIGEAALPALLTLAGGIERVVHWFQGLNETLRNGIVKWGVYGAAALILIGTITNMGASLVALAANWTIVRSGMKLAGDEAVATNTKLAVLGTTMKVLAGIGVIAMPIVIQAIKGGDPGAWSLVNAALMGTVGGAMAGGLPGAIAGALVAPLTIVVMSEFQRDPQDEAEKMYEAYRAGFGKIGRVLKVLGPVSPIKDFEDWIKKYPRLQESHAAFLRKGTKGTSKAMKAYQAMVRKMNRETLDEITNQTENLVKAYSTQDQRLSEQQQRAAQLAQDRVQAQKQALDNMNQQIDSSVKNLESIYENLRQVNEQGMGSIFAGPTMSGFMGNIFSTINDQLRQFGVQVAVPFSILKQDQDQQLTYFKRWRGGLDKLLKRKVPLDMVNQIAALGPTAIPMIEGLLGASKPQLDGYIKDFKNAQALIKKATDADMQRKLKDWEKHGKKIAFMLVSGLASTVAQAEMRAGFKKYVTDTFGDVLKKQMAAEVAAAMKLSMDALNAAAAATKLTPEQQAAANRAAQRTKDATNAKKPINQLTLGQVNRQIALGQERIRRMQKGGITDAETVRIRREVARLDKLLVRRDKLRREKREGDITKTRGGRPGEKPITRSLTINEGDKVTIHADGANPRNVEKAINKHAFRKKNKHRGGSRVQ